MRHIPEIISMAHIFNEFISTVIKIDDCPLICVNAYVTTHCYYIDICVGCCFQMENNNRYFH